MFTGLIETTGALAAMNPREGGSMLRIETVLAAELERGESIAVNGCCLTVEAHDKGAFEVFASDETLAKTTFRGLTAGALLNLERSLRLGDRLGGHLVTGHVDATGEILECSPQGEGWRLRVSFPRELAPLLVEKGSVAIDGISLTCFCVGGDAFEVAIIPETHRVTNLRTRTVGDAVNLEADLIGKYVARHLALRDDVHPGGVTEDLLREAGFLAAGQRVE